MKSIIAITACLIMVAASPAWAGEDEDPLWQAYLRSSPRSANLLAEATAKLVALQAKAVEGAVDPAKDADIAWLLRNRTPATLAVERALREVESDAYYGLLLHVAVRLGHKRLLGKLPQLLDDCESKGRTLITLRAMALNPDAASAEALERFLAASDADTPEQIVVAAAIGLGATRREAYVPALRHGSRLVKTPDARLSVARALHACGDRAAAAEITRVIADANAPEELRLQAVEFAATGRVSSAVPMLGEVAREADTERVRDKAFEAILSITGYGAPPVDQILAKGPDEDIPDGDEHDEGDEELVPSPLEEWNNSRGEARERLVADVLQWWEVQQDAAALPEQGSRPLPAR